MRNSLRIVFAGTPPFASQHLQVLIDHYNIVAVYTQPDRPSGRGRKLTASPVKQLAELKGVPVYQPKNLNTLEVQEELAALEPDLIIVVAYGLILPKKVLNIPTFGCINVHGSLLPAYRGAAPIQRAIMSGDKKTGITIIQMNEGLDTGDMLHKVALPINNDDTSVTLYEKLAVVGQKALKTVIEQIIAQTLKPEKQNGELATYAKKITKEEGKIDWSLSAQAISCHIRGLNPWPVAWTLLNEDVIRCWNVSELKGLKNNENPGTIIKADKYGLIVQCGNDAIVLHTIQLPGKRVMSAQDIVNSRKEQFSAGSVLR